MKRRTCFICKKRIDKDAMSYLKIGVRGLFYDRYRAYAPMWQYAHDECVPLPGIKRKDPEDVDTEEEELGEEYSDDYVYD